jgi:hypothetical protein
MELHGSANHSQNIPEEALIYYMIVYPILWTYTEACHVYSDTKKNTTLAHACPEA